MGILTAIKEVTVTVAAATGAFVAWRGVHAWRKQLKGQTEYELARRMLFATYKVRDAIGSVRHPYMSSGEQAAALADMNPDAEEVKPGSKIAAVQAQAAAYSIRMRGVFAALRDLNVARLEVEALWGSEAAECLTEVRACANELDVALQMYFRRQQQPRTVKARTDFDEKIERTIGFSPDVETEVSFSLRLQQAVELVESFIRPKLK